MITDQQFKNYLEKIHFGDGTYESVLNDIACLLYNCAAYLREQNRIDYAKLEEKRANYLHDELDKIHYFDDIRGDL